MNQTVDEAEFLVFLRRQFDMGDELSLDTRLAELEQWDSLAMVMFVANVDAEYNAAVDGNAVAQAETVRDLYGLV